MIDLPRHLARLRHRAAGARWYRGGVADLGRILLLAAVLFGVASGVTTLVNDITAPPGERPAQGKIAMDLVWIACIVLAPTAGRTAAWVVLAAFATAALSLWPRELAYGWLSLSLAAFAVATARRHVALAVTLAGAGVWAWRATEGTADPKLVSDMTSAVLPTIALAGGIGWALGTAIVRRRVAEDALDDAEQRAHAARHEERIRLSRELHDSVARDLTIISMHSALLRKAALSDDLAYSRTAIEDTSRAALGDLKRLLTVLRTEDSAAGPVFTRDADANDPAGAVAAAAQRLTSLGFTVRHHIEPLAALPRITQATLVRALKEAEANVAKHAPRGAECLIDVRTERRDAVLVVTNTLGGGQASGLPSMGVGVPAVRERVTLLGGHLTAREEDGVWAFRARVPLDPTPEPSNAAVLRRGAPAEKGDPAAGAAALRDRLRPARTRTDGAG